MSFNINEVLEVMKNISKVIEENKQYLTELDAAIGDGDHGLNMSKGFNAAVDKLNNTDIKDIGGILKTVSMALISNVGGASGPLYGTAFMKAGPLGNGKLDMDINDFSSMLEAAIEGIKARGKAVQGEKTMLDALEPALKVIKISIENDLSALEILDKAQKSAYEGVEFTKTIAATKGRASYLGERSIGHQDPGATSSYLILKTIFEKVKEKVEVE